MKDKPAGLSGVEIQAGSAELLGIEVLSELRHRPEGVRIKHRRNFHSVKMYDKQGSVLRVETTITHPRDLKVFRRIVGEPQSELKWRRLRKGVCDLPRRTQVSQASNHRDLDALAAQDTTPLSDLANRVCRSIPWQGRSVHLLRKFPERVMER